MKRNKIFIFLLVALMLLSMATTVVAETQGIPLEDSSKEIVTDLEEDRGEDDSSSEDLSKQPNSSSSVLNDRDGLSSDKAEGSASAEEFKALSEALYRANTILRLNVFASDEDKVAVQNAINHGYEVYGNDNSISAQVNEARDALEAVAYLRTGNYRIVGKQSGKNILSTVSSESEPGKVALFANTMEISKEWYLERLSDGYYTFKYLENNLFLSVDPEKKEADSQLILQPHTGNLQEWEATFNSSGLFMFSNQNTKKYMTVSGGSTAIGTPLVQYSNGNAAAQKFILHKSNADVSGTVTEHTELNTALARLKLILDLDFFLSDDDKKEAQKVYNDGLVVSNNTNAYSGQLYFAKDTADSQAYLRDGRYRLKGKQSDKYILPALNWINYDNSKVKLASSANSADEWCFKRVSDDTYVIQHLKSSYCLTPDPTNLNNDGNLLVLPYTSTYLQRWELDFSDDNSAFRFYNVHTASFMSVSGSLTEDGTQIIQSVKSDTGNQDFILNKSDGDVVASAQEFSDLNTALVHLKTIIDFDFFDSPEEKNIVQKVYDDGMKVFEQKDTKSLQMYFEKEDVLEQTYPRTGRYRITGLSSNKVVVPTLHGENYYFGRVKLSGTADDLSDWLLERQADGSYIIEHLRSGFCLTPIEKGSDSDLVVVPFSGDSLQKWMILISDEANTFLFCNRETGKYMDVSGDSVEEGAQLIQFAFTNRKNQKFYLSKSNANALATPEEIEELDGVIKKLKVIVDLDSYLTTQDKETTQKSYKDAVDVYNNKKATALLVEHTKEDVVSQTYLRSGRYRLLWKYRNEALAPDFSKKGVVEASSTHDDEDEWYFERLIDGTYVVEHVRSGYCLSPDPDQKNTDCSLLAVPFIDNRLQKWELGFDLASSFIFRNVSTKKYMTFRNPFVVQSNSTGEAGQEFSIQKSRLNKTPTVGDFEKLGRAVERIKMIADFDLFAFRDDREIVKQAYSDASAVYNNTGSTVAQVSYATQAAITQAYLRDGEYDLIGKQSGKYILPLSYNKMSIIALNSKKGSDDNDGWDLERQADGSYIVRHMQGSARGDYLSVDPENPSSDTLITTSNTASAVQKWEIIFNDDNSLMLRNVQTQNYMDVYDKETGDGAKVIQAQSTLADNQKFSLRRSKMDVKATEDEFNQLNNIIQRMKIFIGLDEFDSSDDKAIAEKAYNFAQGVYATKISTMAEVFYATKMLEEQAYLRSGRYYLIGKQSGKYILPFGFNDGSKMVLESIRDFTKYEDWEFTRQSDGTYVMRHLNFINRTPRTFFILGLNPNDMDGQDLMMTNATGTDIQKWEIVFDDNNVLMLRNLKSGKYLDVKNGGTENLTRVIQFKLSNTENQKFILQTSNAYKLPFRYAHLTDVRRMQWFDGFYHNVDDLWA